MTRSRPDPLRRAGDAPGAPRRSGFSRESFPADSDGPKNASRLKPLLPERQSEGLARRAVRRWQDGRYAAAEDTIAEEIPVAVLCNDRPHVVMMATPRDLEDFALGFCLSEAIIADAGELQAIETRPLLEGIELRLTIPAARVEALAARQRNLVGRSGCGLCGAQALEDAVRRPQPVGTGPRIAPAALQRALAELPACQPLNAATGAIHAAAWARADGGLVAVREDVGRHNALDKLIGALVRVDADLRSGFALVTSRASYEMVQKAATVGIAILAAISAPTALAIHLADEAGLTLIGFARAGGHVVYAQPERIEPGKPAA